MILSSLPITTRRAGSRDAAAAAGAVAAGAVKGADPDDGGELPEVETPPGGVSVAIAIEAAAIEPDAGVKVIVTDIVDVTTVDTGVVGDTAPGPGGLARLHPLRLLLTTRGCPVD